MTTGLTAQTFTDYAWTHRVLMNVSMDEHDPRIKQQIDSLQTDMAGLRVRKLKLLTIIPDDPQFDRYHQAEQPFSVRLFGLDTGPKHCQSKPITAIKLYSIFDSMPIRRSEMDDQ